MLKILIPAVAALGLAAHAAQSYTLEGGGPVSLVERVAATPAEPAPAKRAAAAPVRAPAATPVMAPVMDWYFHTEGDTAKLAYGVANSDQLVLMLTCKPGDAKVSTLGTVRAMAETATAYSTMEDPMSGGVLHESEIDRRDAALADLAATGAIQAISAQGQMAVGSDAADKTAVKEFFAYCGTARS